MAAPHPRNVPALGYFHSGRPQFRDEIIVIGALERGMSLLCRSEILFHSKVDLHRAAFKPAASTLSQISRLRDFSHPQEFCVKFPRGFLLVCRHGKLDMINRSERQVHD